MRKRATLGIVIVVMLGGCRTVPPDAGLTPFTAQGLWGYRNAAGRPVIQPRYLAAEEFSPQGLAAVADDQGWAYLNRRGEEVIRPFVFDNGPDPFQEGLARFVSDGKFGFFDETGRVVIPPRYDFAYPFSDGRAKVGMDCRLVPDGEHQRIEGGTWSEIDRDGNPRP